MTLIACFSFFQPLLSIRNCILLEFLGVFSFSLLLKLIFYSISFEFIFFCFLTYLFLLSLSFSINPFVPFFNNQKDIFQSSLIFFRLKLELFYYIFVYFYLFIFFHHSLTPTTSLPNSMLGLCLIKIGIYLKTYGKRIYINVISLILIKNN